MGIEDARYLKWRYTIVIDPFVQAEAADERNHWASLAQSYQPGHSRFTVGL